MIVRRFTTILALFGVLSMSVIAGSANAGSETLAATPTCNEYTLQFVYWGVFTVYPSYGSDSFDTNCLLSDSRADGTAVYYLEHSLRYCHNQQRVNVDRVFDGDTTTAVRTVQRFFGLREDGIFGPATSRAMLWSRWGTDGSYYGCGFRP